MSYESAVDADADRTQEQARSISDRTQQPTFAEHPAYQGSAAA
jgi:hypothetical protein